jgi:hypothetical protein
VGRAGAKELQSLRLGRGTSQHALVSGKTGSGKSTLLHALITNLALHYSPREVEFYLVDFKKGVEFKTYATGELPHARVIAIESEREFGVSVLERLDVPSDHAREVARCLVKAELRGMTFTGSDRNNYRKQFESQVALAVKEWRFIPEQVAGHAIPVRMQVPVDFCVTSMRWCTDKLAARPKAMSSGIPTALDSAVALKTDIRSLEI